MELACERLVRDLLSGGYEVDWLAQRDSPLPDLPNGVCKPFSASDLVYDLSGVPLPIPYPTAIGSALSSIRQAELAIIVEANFAISVLCYLVARLVGTPVMLVQHVGKPSTVSRFARLIMQVGERLFTRLMIRNADSVVYVSRSVAAYFEGVRSKPHSETINHAIDVDLFRPLSAPEMRSQVRQRLGLPDDAPIACFVGRTTSSKGIEVIRCLAKVKPDWTFVIAGKGPVDPSDWGLPNVNALGQLSLADVAALYSSSDVMILPSQSESFSLVVREAIACGCPVICSDQILETDPRLAPFIVTAPVDLSDPVKTASAFSASLGEAMEKDREAGRDYIARECSPDTVRFRYLAAVSDAIGRPNAVAL